jgi:hypothetical protein
MTQWYELESGNELYPDFDLRAPSVRATLQLEWLVWLVSIIARVAVWHWYALELVTPRVESLPVWYGAISDHGARYITFKVDECMTALCSSSKMRPQLSLIAFLSFLLFTGASQAAQDAEKQPEMSTRSSLCLQICGCN